MKKLLIVEDDVDMTDILRIALAAKYDLKIVHDSKSIPSALENFLPDVLLLDNFIGQSKATEVLKEIKLLNELKIIPFILFSAHPDIEKIAITMNANGFLPKPFKLTELYACLDKVISENIQPV